MNQVKAHIAEAQMKTDWVRQPRSKPTEQNELASVQSPTPQAVYRETLLNVNGPMPIDILALQRSVGNRQVQRLLARRIGSANKPQQHKKAPLMIARDDLEPAQGATSARAASSPSSMQASPPVEGARSEPTEARPDRIEITEEEAGVVEGPAGLPSIADIEMSMREDMQMTQSTQEILYINMPELIAGMGYTADRMQRIFRPLQQGRDRIVQPAYSAWRAQPTVPARRAAFDQAMARFESEVGTGVRQQIRNYWQSRRVGDPANAKAIITALQAITRSLASEHETLFSSGSESPITLPALLEISAPRAIQSRLRAYSQCINGDLIRRTNGLRADNLGRSRTRRSVASLTRAAQRINQVISAIQRQLRGRAVSTLRTGLDQAIQQIRDAVSAFTLLVSDLQNHNRRITYMVTRIMNAQALPILVPTTRQSATVTFHGQQTRFRTHHESRMAYYAQPFQLTGVPTPSRLPAATGGHSNVPTGARERRMFDVYSRLRNLQVPVSEAKILAAIAGGEGSFSTTQTIDRVRFSWGIIQFQGMALMSLLRLLKERSPSIFAAYFETYGITIRQPGQTLAPVRPASRYVPGQEQGIGTSEAQGVDSLFVYDHSARAWTRGNEALAVIQRDPRYQALFVAAAQETDVQAVQMLAARGQFIHAVRNTSLMLGSAGSQRRLRISDFVNSEVAMFGLVERKVATGNISFATRMFNAYLQARRLTVESLQSSPHQADIASWVRGYQRIAVRWTLGEGLSTANVPALRNDSYAGNP